MKVLKPYERIIVAADYDTPDKVLALAEALKGTGVILKANSALRYAGYELIKTIHACDLGFFADLKLTDIPATLAIDGKLLVGCRPDILTVMASTGPKAMAALKAQLPDTEVLGVTVLTSMSEEECESVYGCGVDAGIIRFAQLASKAGLDGLILAPKDVVMLKQCNMLPEGMTTNTPNIRPESVVIEGDDQNKARGMTPTEAIQVGITRLVIGRPITQAKSPRDAVMRIIDEIERACSMHQGIMHQSV